MGYFKFVSRHADPSHLFVWSVTNVAMLMESNECILACIRYLYACVGS